MAGRKIFSLFGSIAIEGMAKTKAEFTEFDKKARAVSKSMNRLGRDMAKTGKSITKNLTMPIGLAAAAAIKFGADFDQAMTNSIAIMGDVSDAMREDLEQTARDVAKTTKFSATEAAQAYFFLASAGLSAAESIEALPRVAKFAQAGNFDLAKATDLLTDAQSALGMSSEDTAKHMENMNRVSDVLVKANTVANATVEQFSESLTNKAGAALRLLNKDVEEGAAVLAVYADQGVKGKDAGTQLHIVLRDLQKAAVNNGEAFKSAGISVFDAEGNMRNIADVVSDLEGRLGGMSDEQKRLELATLGFSDKSIAATQALIGTSDAMKEYEETLRQAAGTTQDIADKQMNTLWAQLGLLKDAAIDLALTFFDKLGPVLMDTIIPAFQRLLEVVGAVFAWFGRHKNISIFAGTFIGVAAALGPVLLLFAKLVPLIKTLKIVYLALTTAQISLNAAMAANPIGLIVLAVAALTAATVVLVKNWKTVKRVFFDVWDGIVYHFKNIASRIAIMYSKMIQGILKGVQAASKWIPGSDKGLQKLINTYGVAIKVMERGIAHRKKLRAEQNANKKSAEAEAAAIESSTEALDENTEATDKNANTKKKQSQSVSKQAAKDAEDAKRLAQEAANHERKVQNELEAATIVNLDNKLEAQQRSTALKLKMLNEERDEEIRLAEEAGLSTVGIAETYEQKKLEVQRAAAAEEVKIAHDVQKEKISGYNKVLNTVGSVVSSINGLWGRSLDIRKGQLDKEAEERKANAQATIKNEEELAVAIEAIDAETAEKKKELEREDAIRKKSAAIFGSIISTAAAVAAALPNIPLSITVGILGLAQTALIAAQPIPFAEGGLVKSNPGQGVFAQIGESTQDELVLPMKTGAAELASNIMQQIAGAGSTATSTISRTVREVHNHYHIGTLIADEMGVKKFAKKVNKYQVAEAQRTGGASATA